jgi:Tfp pilus assembly protein PilF
MLERQALALLLVAAMMSGAGCMNLGPTSQPAGGYRTITVDPRRDTEAAKQANRLGMEHMARGEVVQAVAEFNRALTADVSFGPAHNNLGKAYYAQKEWYKAAWEFEYAKKLLPRHPEPRNNLGLVLEMAGELDRAVESYREAGALDGNNMQYCGNLARALVRRGDRTEELRSLLEQLVARDTRTEWLAWARLQRACWRAGADREGMGQNLAGK